MRYEIRVPLAYPYKNQLTPSPSMRSFIRFKEVKQEWGWYLKSCARVHRQGPLPRRLTITRVYSKKQRQFDIGNLYYPAAIIIDLLVGIGWLRDDNPKWLSDLHCNQRQSQSPECWTEIVIEDVDGDPTPRVPSRA